MKALTRALLVFTLVACGRRVTTGNEDDLKAAEIASATATHSAFELYFSNPLPALIQRLRGSLGKTRPSDEVLDKWATLQDSQIAGGGGFHEALVNLMATASGDGCALLVADYDFDVEAVAQAMADAKDRGCDVRFVTDGVTVAKSDPSNAKFQEEYKAPFDILKRADIAIHNDGDRAAIMHDKFVVVRGKTGDAVWSGSWNFTNGDEVNFWNNGIAIHSKLAADIYTEAFEALYQRIGEDGSVGTRVKLQLPLGRTFTAGGVPFEVFFPSTDKATNRLVELIGTAQASIHVLAFSFTSAPLADAVVERVTAGVDVMGIVENSGACSGAFKTLTELPAEQQKHVSFLRWVYGPSNFLHHKVMIIDERTVVFGSFNFSGGADTSNDENLLIADDADFAKNFVDAYNFIEQVTADSPQPDACD